MYGWCSGNSIANLRQPSVSDSVCHKLVCRLSILHLVNDQVRHRRRVGMGFKSQCRIVFDGQELLCYSSLFADAGWSSLAARRAHNPKVVGSNPAPATQRKRIKNIDWRGKIDLYNAHLFDATAATAKAEKFFKIQIKQPISVGMWAGEFNR